MEAGGASFLPKSRSLRNNMKHHRDPGSGLADVANMGRIWGRTADSSI